MISPNASLYVTTADRKNYSFKLCESLVNDFLYVTKAWL